MSQRYLFQWISKDLASKMVFVGGPRQVGKTTLARHIGEENYAGHYAYLNWDIAEQRTSITQNRLPAGKQLLIFDELHKYARWKNWIKGVFDSQTQEHILVTGSARLDVYRHGGDSLLGRYHYFRLHPFSLAEVVGISSVVDPFQLLSFEQATPESTASLEKLFRVGGFPEPLFSTDERMIRRWQTDRVDRLVTEDIRDLEYVRQLSLMRVLADMLPQRVGSVLSINSLREDLNVAHKTAAHWIDIFERMYYCYRVFPYATRAIAALKKEPKLYLWDWSEVQNEAARWENLVAGHLLKFVHFLKDVHGHRAELWYLRDTAGREVDFLVTVDHQPWFAVEVKESDSRVSRHTLYMKEKLGIPFVYQVVAHTKEDVMDKGVRVLSVAQFLSGLV